MECIRSCDIMNKWNSKFILLHIIIILHTAFYGTAIVSAGPFSDLSDELLTNESVSLAMAYEQALDFLKKQLYFVFQSYI